MLRKRSLDLTSELTNNCFYIPVSVAINDSLTNEPIFTENQDPECRLIEEFVAELNRRQEIVLREV